MMLGCCAPLCIARRITNAPVADVFVVWARVKGTGELRGFVLERVRSC